MAKVLDLKRKVNKLVKKSKVTDEGFSYLCDNCDFECVGRKGIIEHIKETHEEHYSELKSGFEDTTDKDFQSQLSKLVMNVPFCDKDAKAKKDIGTVKSGQVKKNATKIVENRSTIGPQVVEVQEEPAEKSYPLTMDFMRTIDGRTTKIPDYGSLVGRIARLVAMVVKKENEEEVVKLTCNKCDEDIKGYTDIFGHIEKDHSDFLLHLYTMFPPARKRMDQFISRAAENFELVVPTWEEVNKLQRLEKEKQVELRRLEMKKKLEEAEKARAELKVKREEVEKNRLTQKRKQEEEAKIKEFKILKIDPEDEKAEEKLRCKKEILRIEISLKEKSITEIRKTRLTTKLNELKNKLKKDGAERKEKIINKRMETCLENLSPKQLRKLCLEYLNNIDNRGQDSWKHICESVKIGDDYEFLTDFLGVLYEFAQFNGKKSFKVGHILVTSKQSDSILEKGVWSVRDFVKKESWRIPSSWDVDIPEDDLGEEWNRKDDSRLIIGASRFGKNLCKIIKSYPSMAIKALDSSGAVLGSVKRRFGYLLNVYMNRGVAVEEFGHSLYSVDVEEVEEMEAEEDDDLMEIHKNDNPEIDGDKKGVTESEKEDQIEEDEDVMEIYNNESSEIGVDKNDVTESEKTEQIDKDDDEIEELEEMEEEEMKEEDM